MSQRIICDYDGPYGSFLSFSYEFMNSLFRILNSEFRILIDLFIFLFFFYLQTLLVKAAHISSYAGSRENEPFTIYTT